MMYDVVVSFYSETVVKTGMTDGGISREIIKWLNAVPSYSDTIQYVKTSTQFTTNNQIYGLFVLTCLRLAMYYY